MMNSTGKMMKMLTLDVKMTTALMIIILLPSWPGSSEWAAVSASYSRLHPQSKTQTERCKKHRRDLETEINDKWRIFKELQETATVASLELLEDLCPKGDKEARSRCSRQQTSLVRCFTCFHTVPGGRGWRWWWQPCPSLLGAGPRLEQHPQAPHSGAAGCWWTGTPAGSDWASHAAWCAETWALLSQFIATQHSLVCWNMGNAFTIYSDTSQQFLLHFHFVFSSVPGFHILWTKLDDCPISGIHSCHTNPTIVRQQCRALLNMSLIGYYAFWNNQAHRLYRLATDLQYFQTNFSYFVCAENMYWFHHKW